MVKKGSISQKCYLNYFIDYIAGRKHAMGKIRRFRKNKTALKKDFLALCYIFILDMILHFLILQESKNLQLFWAIKYSYRP